MYFSDALTLDTPRRLDGGAVAVRARAARVGHYAYTGAEVDPENKHGLRDKAVVNVLRDEATVFDERAVRSFIGKPITDNHPTQPVTADNWRDHARGTIMGAVRDGDYLAFDLLLTDADAIAKVQGGKRELSNGYSSTLEFGSFQAADGTMCEARQASIFGNHIAIVDRGRAGPECRIADAATCEALTADQLSQFKTKEKPVAHTMMVDGYSVDIADAKTAEATINKLLGERNDARTKLSDAETTVAAKDTEIATLKTEKQQLVDAKPTPAQLRDAAKAYAQVVGKAKAVGVDVTDSMDDNAIMKAVVTKVMGDAANGWNDAQIAASFAVATKDAKVDDANTVVPLGDARATVTDAAARDKALNDRNAHLRDAWKRPAAA